MSADPPDLVTKRLAAAAANTRAIVPCGTCRACCKYELVALYPEDGDDVDSYQHDSVTLHTGESIVILKRKPNGDCIYLDAEHGCTIHDRAPIVCQAFDCRGYFLKYDRQTRRLLSRRSPHTKEVFEAGRKRLRESG